MTTDLFAMTRGIDPAVLRGAIPPACFGALLRGSAVAVDRDEALIEMPACTPRRPARHFVPSLALLDASAIGFRFELSIPAGGGWSPWVESVTLGRARFAPGAGLNDALRCDVDVFSAATSAEAVRARVRVSAPDVGRVLASGWLFALSMCDLERAPVPSAGVDGGVEIPVPSLSQMEANDAVARRICSPACVAMILRRWGHVVDLEALAAEMFQPDVDLYGVWPAAIAAAARRGLAGYVLRFPDWSAVRWCLDAGLPIVASVRYAKGELTRAAIAETTGHLVVLTGYDGEDVLVSDPAAPRRSDVARRYARSELERVWLERSGVGYVFFQPM